ncbi:MAG: anaerobic C4-dicarboxylate transporter family protein [Symbiopectobacterium sp.]|uniref:anaerobic C4-dicarboxylate transporter family protein n=1 Tax=Symbiopectobacterium sp. TaxID=2952789 RepID=UPI003F2D40F2
MFAFELVIVLLAIYLGARLGGIGIGFAGGLGVLVLTLVFQIKLDAIPFDVIQIIMAVIAAIAAMQVAGGMDYLMSLAEKLLRRQPKYVTYSGTGNTAFSTLPVIAEVAKEKGIRPSRPLSIAVVASQAGIVTVILYATAISDTVGLIAKPILPRYVKAHIGEIQGTAGALLQNYPWILAVILFFASTLLYSQAATAKTLTLMPAVLLLGVTPVTAVASFAAVSALFVLPTYPTLLAAVEMDDTGSTRIGKYVFNHAFLVPGVLAITLSVIFGFILGNLVL